MEAEMSEDEKDIDNEAFVCNLKKIFTDAKLTDVSSPQVLRVRQISRASEDRVDTSVIRSQ